MVLIVWRTVQSVVTEDIEATAADLATSTNDEQEQPE
jgi:hypothetical protein